MYPADMQMHSVSDLAVPAAQKNRSQRSLSSKNKLFEAKILELQARLLYSAPRPTGGAHWADGTPRFRSPLIKDESGSLVYRSDESHHPKDHDPRPFL